MQVKLKENLDKAELGFYDLSTGKKIAPKKFGKGESFQVEESSFVLSKIDSGELILVETTKSEETTKSTETTETTTKK
jgi:hypothetical protein